MQNIAPVTVSERLFSDDDGDGVLFEHRSRFAKGVGPVKNPIGTVEEMPKGNVISFIRRD
jgi:hypothetical protein